MRPFWSNSKTEPGVKLNFLRIMIQWIDSLNENIGKGISWLTTLLVLVVCFDVFTRYFLKSSSVGVQELEWHLFALIFLVSAAYTFKDDRHVRVDVFYTNFSQKTKAWVDLFGSLILLLPFSIITIIASKQFVLSAFFIQESSPDPGGLPARYLLKAVIPIAFLLVALQAIAQISKSILIIQNESSSTPEKLN